MERRQNASAGETRDPRENPPINGVVRHDSHMRKSGVTRLGIETGSPWWEASRLTAQPPFCCGRAVLTICYREAVSCLLPYTGEALFVPSYNQRSDTSSVYRTNVWNSSAGQRLITERVHLPTGQEVRERYGRHEHARLAPHRSYVKGVQCFRRGPHASLPARRTEFNAWPVQSLAGPIPGLFTPGFSHVGIVPDDVARQRVFSGSSVYTVLSFRRCSILTSITLIGSQDLATRAILASCFHFRHCCIIRTCVGPSQQTPQRVPRLREGRDAEVITPHSRVEECSHVRFKGKAGGGRWLTSSHANWIAATNEAGSRAGPPSYVDHVDPALVCAARLFGERSSSLRSGQAPHNYTPFANICALLKSTFGNVTGHACVRHAD
ncbi:hypothetical protein PR048_011664 [Dryococelus australis]|uniref:Uncharacterized protein n=1 Tax=Dryococelus australis TaxID=614101 RepID=A0ABQ9HMA2_9NEOP|nr:hypothetical protein PR048_011664 [Dryococelus australis]